MTDGAGILGALGATWTAAELARPAARALWRDAKDPGAPSGHNGPPDAKGPSAVRAGQDAKGPHAARTAELRRAPAGLEPLAAERMGPRTVPEHARTTVLDLADRTSTVPMRALDDVAPPTVPMRALYPPTAPMAAVLPALELPTVAMAAVRRPVRPLDGPAAPDRARTARPAPPAPYAPPEDTRTVPELLAVLAEIAGPDDVDRWEPRR